MSAGHVPYVLIGAGTASFAAAKAIREADPQAKVSQFLLPLCVCVHITYLVRIAHNYGKSVNSIISVTWHRKVKLYALLNFLL